MPVMIPVFYLNLDVKPVTVTQQVLYTIDATEAFKNAPDRFFRTQEDADEALAALPKLAKAKKDKAAANDAADDEVVPVIPLVPQK